MAFQDLTAKKDFWNGENVKEGDVLEGTIKLITPSRGPKSSPVMLVEKEDGTQVNVWMKTLIHSTLDGVAKEGDKIRLTYLGKKAPQNGGQEYHDYKVELDR